MSTSILATKLYIPTPRPGLVQRPRLNSLLESILTAPLTLISAPAGFGKSTLISSWISSHSPLLSASSNLSPHKGRIVPTQEVRSAWLSLDPVDDDPARFWEYFLAALASLKLERVRFDQSQALLQGQENPPYQLILTDLINQVVDLEFCAVVVLDDLQVIQSPQIHEGLIFLVEHLPRQMHLVFSTRSDPPFPLGRWRVRGWLHEIRSAQLRFDLAEAGAYFNQLMGLRLDDQQVADLENRTEGWVAGLQMAALSLRDQDPAEISDFISGFSGQHHLILDFLTDEVLRRQPEHIQQFLLKTSILSHLHGPLCDALLSPQSNAAAAGIPTAVNLLEQLEHANLFIIPLDGNRNWYRCHHLFRELLLVRLRETYPGEITSLHRKASTWYENNGFPFEAMQHALAVQDVSLAADVIERTIRKPATWSTGNMTRMLDAVKALPEDVVDARPWLRVYLSGILYVGGFLENADQMLARIESKLQPGAGQAEISMYTNVYRAYYAAVRGDVSAAVQRSQQALERLPEDDLTVRGHALSALGWANYLTGNVERAGSLLKEAVQNQRRKNARFTMTTWLCNLANVQMAQGKQRDAAQTCEEAIQAGTTGSGQSPTVGLAMIYLGAIYYEWNRLAEAEEQIRLGIQLMQAGGITPNFGLGHAVLAQVCHANGKPEEGAALIQAGVQIARNSRLNRYIELVSAIQARQWLAGGKVSQALGWAAEFRQLPPAEYLREFSMLTLARVYHANGQDEDALACCEEVIAAAKAAGRMGPVLEALVILSAAQSGMPGLEGKAQSSLQAAVSLAAPEGRLRIFLDCGPVMIERIKQLSFSNPDESEFVSGILSAYSGDNDVPFGPSRTSAHRVDQAGLVEPLTARELEILQLMSTGMTNGEIAQQLHVTLNTMRAHSTHIFGKLGVHNRTEAAAKARDLNLI